MRAYHRLRINANVDIHVYIYIYIYICIQCPYNSVSSHFIIYDEYFVIGFSAVIYIISLIVHPVSKIEKQAPNRDLYHDSPF